MASQGSWAQVRQQARAQETQTEALFHTYAQFASTTDIDPEPSDEEQRTEEQLNEILEKVPPSSLSPDPQPISPIHQTNTLPPRHQRSALLQHLARLLDSEPTPPSALKSTNLARHREILQQHRTELSRLKSSLATARDRANLLSNVRRDISAYRSAQNPNSQNPNSDPHASEAEYMLGERGRLDNSHSMMDSVLSQAYATNESFGLQRETLSSIQRRITGAAAQVPGINGLMQRIGSKKRRDGIILGGLIGVCCLLLLWFW
ncbi:protein transport protein gos1 [Friedmanniomyces endolithicus]|uniref:Protein transport protein gos1 n=1 Tax=Friedmanniomyces endolithicus TaxID=329885 RepID=A0AAN6HD04_9PEZI|nr:protein transport protein gos1 [Friedmanniomyces endolithicus]KAK0265265.1 protein transport protein gos1 [Friedmanniomyces endolithicus]KAK0278880.1 protein transport protein gos1 [Friedmanniomyces endolithicus]KAK0313202.1 protein transport protein gos1 [Friedmanniomyces endolithicus]KAK0896553.1 protein transport protein gos1 [Friedmanniomyces endolithicus]